MQDFSLPNLGYTHTLTHASIMLTSPRGGNC